MTFKGIKKIYLMSALYKKKSAGLPAFLFMMFLICLSISDTGE